MISARDVLFAASLAGRDHLCATEMISATEMRSARDDLISVAEMCCTSLLWQRRDDLWMKNSTEKLGFLLF
jgi:hypothetical protein